MSLRVVWNNEHRAWGRKGQGRGGSRELGFQPASEAAGEGEAGEASAAGGAEAVVVRAVGDQEPDAP